MSRVISFRDLQLIPELKKYNEIEMLHPSLDGQINGYLEELGFNTNMGILYVPNKHRDMQGKVAVGFLAVGEIDSYGDYLRSALCTVHERILAAAGRDMSLAKEMASMLGSGTNMTALNGPEFALDEDDDEFPDDQIEPDYEEVTAEITALVKVRDSIRGSCYNEYGNIKVPKEYVNA